MLTTVSLGQPALAASCSVGETGGRVRLPFHFGLEAFDVFEAEDLAAAHEVDDIAGGAVDGVHADEVGFAVDADAVEAVVDVGLHGIEGVVGIAERPAFVVSEDSGDVIELRSRGGEDAGALVAAAKERSARVVVRSMSWMCGFRSLYC